MSDKIVEIRPGAMRKQSREQAGWKTGWHLGDDGRWNPVSIPDLETIKGPFVLAMQAHMEKLVAEAAHANYIEGSYQGARGMLPYVGVAAIAGLLIGLVL